MNQTIPSTLEPYVAALHDAFPDLAIEAAEGNITGQFNVVLLINRAWIFRFPRYPAGVAELEAETRLLARLKRQRLPLPTPNPVYTHFDPPVPGRACMGYRRMPGQPLYRNRLAEINSPMVQARLAAQLADFLRALHAVPLAEVAPGKPVQDGAAQWADMYIQVRQKLFPAMRADARQQVSAHFEAFLADSQPFTPVLRHGDFGGSNILFLPGPPAALTGVIDFSFCAPGDPATDLAAVSTLETQFFPPGGFCTMLLERYEPDPTRQAALLARARFYRSTFALSEALIGYDNADKDAYQRGLAQYV